ncbi:hypothetical protein B0A52_00057 [Exophiala mesophila]|uniref:HMG box domain-containing protein n=1 Tax=Exophiala mesophila TaxID=212818 RepID=A0A438NIZ5_EXOME|nr:hypothetical protein B0A52_00057 [Exophiala mesophila]
MTPPAQDPPPPALHRRLPNPAPNGRPASRRPSSLSQHDIFPNPVIPCGFADNASRRSTFHFPPPSASRLGDASDQMFRSMSTTGHESASREARGGSTDSAIDRVPHDSGPNVCLCQPDPKIPRPRNSFILFRQAQQANIIAQNPGIPNPEVSKIIGKQWQHLSAEAKEEWNTLAELEKARHQEQYPGYRYHPRRTGRNSSHSSITGPSSTEHQEPCSKCGKKPITHPIHSPAAPTHPPAGTISASKMAVQIPAKRGYIVSNSHMQRPHHAPPAASPEYHGQPQSFVEAYPFSRVDPRLIYAVPPSAQRTPPTDSQEAKRRRYDSNGMYIAAGQPYPEHSYAYPNSPSAAYTRGEPGRQMHAPHAPLHRPHPVQLTKPALISPPRGLYPHPPQLQPVRPPPAQQQRTASSVALPPIETMVSPFPHKTGWASTTSQSSGVEAMIMSIPVLNRIRVLSQISSPLPSPGLTSPKPDVRGAIIAIEGMDAASVMSMACSLADQLEKEGNFAVKIFEGPNPYQSMREARNITARHHKTLTAESYLQMLSEWHRLNKEMVEYITTRPGQSGTRDAPITLDSSQMISTRTTRAMDTPSAASPIRKWSIVDEKVDDTSESLYSAVSPKTLVGAPDRSTTPPPAPKPRSQSQAEGTLPVTGGRDFESRPPSLALPRPLYSSRIPPPPPPPPPTPPIPPPPPSSKLVSRLSLAAGVEPSRSTVDLVTQATHPQSEAEEADTQIIDECGAELQASQASLRYYRPSSINSPTAVPIAIVPHFQLTTVDASSISMPISDGFSPPAHWQWFATLWRGSVGPDVTVVIKSTDEESVEAGTAGASATVPSLSNADPTGGNTGGVIGNTSSYHIAKPSTATSSTSSQPKAMAASISGSNTTMSASASSSGVEVRLHDCRAVIVKTGIFGVGLNSGAKPAGPNARSIGAKELENWEKSKRRVGFEVEEFLRK